MKRAGDVTDDMFGSSINDAEDKGLVFRFVSALRISASTRCITFFLSHIVLLTGLGVGFFPSTCGQTNESARLKVFQLELRKPIKKEIPQGEAHIYQLSLTAGEYMRVEVKELSGFNLLATLTGPDKRQLFSTGTSAYDVAAPLSLAEALKIETIEYVAEESGVYTLQVRRHDSIEPAIYQIEITDRRPAAEHDRLRANATKAFSEAERWRSLDYKADSLQQALRKYDQALAIWRMLGEKKEEAKALNSIGITQIFVPAKQAASDYFKQALEMWRAAGDLQGEAVTLHNLVCLLYGEQESITYLEQALQLWRSLDDRRWEAITLFQLGLAYSVLQNQAKALDFFEQSLRVWQTVDDRTSEAHVYFYLAETYDSLGDKQKCREYYQRAQQSAQEHNFRDVIVSSLLRLGETYFVEGGFNEALGYYDQALTLSRHTGRPEEAYALYNLGGVYFAFNEKERALEYFQQSLPLWGYNLNGEAYSLEYIGRIYSALGQRQIALANLQQALPLMQTTSDRYGEALIWNDIGQTYAAEGNARQALECYYRALRLSQETSHKDVEAHTLINIGGVYDGSGDWQQAATYYEQALALFIAFGHKGAEANARYLLARLRWKRRDLNEARAQIEEALKIVESLRARIVSDELRYAYFASVREYYDLYLDVLMLLHGQHPAAGFDRTALEVSERGRARSLLEILTESRVNIREGVDQALVERERLLRQRLNDKAQRQMRLLSGQHTEEQAAVAAKEVANLLTENQQLQLQIRINNPRYAALTQPQPLSLEQIQQQTLDVDTVLLEYALGQEGSYVWVVSHDSLASYALPSREEIERVARTFYGLLKTQDKDAADLDLKEKQLRTAAEDLSDMVLAPVAGQLRAKRLLIVGDGILQYIPFAALADPSITNSASAPNVRQHEYRPLIERYEIIHLPSASTLAVLRDEMRERQPASLLVGVVADPVFSATDERVKRAPLRRSKIMVSAGSEEQSDKLDSSAGRVPLTRALRDAGIGVTGETIPRLPYTRREAAAIMGLVQPRDRLEALDFAANRQLVTSGELAQYRIIHFATHGLLDVKEPELSGLIFSLVDERGQPQDGFLRLHDIYNLKLRADLVVLSACQTGLGKDVRGEGLVGLTRGFMYSGAARVMTSLWKVDDAATAELMKRFYEAMLKEKQSPASALRSAELGLWQSRRWRSPSNWSAFMIQGEWK